MASKCYPDPHKQVDAGYFWWLALIAGKFAVLAVTQKMSVTEKNSHSLIDSLLGYTGR